MKKIFLIASAFIVGFTASAQQKADDFVKLKAEKFDFGKISLEFNMLIATNGIYLDDHILVVRRNQLCTICPIGFITIVFFRIV